MSNLQLFENSSFGNLRIITTPSNELWFVGKDVCDILGTLTKHLPSIIDPEERMVDSIDLGNGLGLRKTVLISESGFYQIVLKSRKPIAKPFQKWVTKEVLPSIRKTGTYNSRPMSIDEVLQLNASMIKQLRSENQDLKAKGNYEFEKNIKSDKIIKRLEQEKDIQEDKLFDKWENIKHFKRF